MKLADIATNIIDNQNENIDDNNTDNQINDDKLSGNDSNIPQDNEINEMVIKF